jgi:hypothetical protein
MVASYVPRRSLPSLSRILWPQTRPLSRAAADAALRAAFDKLQQRSQFLMLRVTGVPARTTARARSRERSRASASPPFGLRSLTRALWPQTRPLSKGPPVPRARKRLPPKKTDGVSLREDAIAFRFPAKALALATPLLSARAKVASAMQPKPNKKKGKRHGIIQHDYSG